MYALSYSEIEAIRLKVERVSELKRAIREVKFTAMVEELENRGLIKNVEHVGENAYGVTLGYASWAALARKAAGLTSMPGIMQPTRAGIVWIDGGGGPHGALIDNTPSPEPINGKNVPTSRLDAVIRARTAMSKTEYVGKVPWTLGGIGKKLLLFSCQKDIYRPSCEQLFHDEARGFHINQGYHICKPGEYESAKLYDVSGYYFNIFRRVSEEKRRSLRVIITRSGINFQSWQDGERERFLQVIEAVKNEKGLRNAMVGAGQGSLGWRIAYASAGCEPGKAKRFMLKGKPGPFRPYCLLTVRTGYELTQKEALTNSAIYAMIDSVMLTQGQPKVWQAYGLTVERKYNGDAEVIARGNYRIGLEAKEAFRMGIRNTEAETGNIVLPFHYHEKWL